MLKPTIPQCRYVIRKGEAPHPGRANILPWSPALAMRPDEFEPFLDPLPPLPLRPGETPPAPPKSAPTQAETVAALRAITILEAIDRLEHGEFTKTGTPKLEALRTLTGYEITIEERDVAWAGYLARKNHLAEARLAPPPRMLRRVR